MNNVNKTLYIPLYGKAYVSQRGLLLHDPRAEAVWDAEGFTLKGKAKSKWLAYYMGMRAAVFDDWLRGQMDAAPDAVIVHIGCGMDSRAERVGTRGHLWFDVDFPEVIRERQRYYRESGEYRMLGADVGQPDWLAPIPEAKRAIVVMEGVSMYLQPEALSRLLGGIARHFEEAVLLMDCYTILAARLSGYRNPINQVGVTRVFGMDDPSLPARNTGLVFVKAHDMTPAHLIDTLPGPERGIFRKLYAGSLSRKLYRLYEYRSGS